MFIVDKYVVDHESVWFTFSSSMKETLADGFTS